MRLRLEHRIIKFLVNNPEGVLLQEIAKEISGTKVGDQLQGYRLTVENPRVAADTVLKDMVTRELVRAITRRQTEVYTLSEKAREKI